MTPEYYLEDHPEFSARLAAYDEPLLFFSFSDDDFAPKVNADWLWSKFTRAQGRRRHIEPATVGLASIGHFGFFRRESATVLWPEAHRFLDEVEVGRFHASRAGLAPQFETAEIMDDLHYGRV